jgi:ACS family sodium-dependent inorganic phosphate cotransporter
VQSSSSSLKPDTNGSSGGDNDDGGNGTNGSGAPWYTVVALSAMAALICSIDRAAISVAILPMSEEYGWSDSTKGAVNAAFYAGYTVTNLAGGYLAATVGSKRTLGTGVAVWSAFTVLTPWAAATRAMPLLLSVRCLMGCGEGTAYPCIQAVVKGWVPRDARSRALTLIYSGGQLGTIIALLTAPAIIGAAGWEAVFWVYGSLGALWLLAWQPLVAEVPPLYSHRGAGAASTAAALSGVAEVPAAAATTAAAPTPAAAGEQGSNSSSSSSSSSNVHSRSRSKPEMLITSSSDDDEASGRQLSVPGLLEVPWRQFFSNRAFLGIVVAHR